MDTTIASIHQLEADRRYLSSTPHYPLNGGWGRCQYRLKIERHRFIQYAIREWEERFSRAFYSRVICFWKGTFFLSSPRVV
ncbi:hypothetical protein CEXT_457141 [Caerostris extrusa]|uniref:Uncharacterized protein n=1 Tax=Caerostris extrusa TaxID=172846 RepID=A0AAV4QJ75_CAEEX|nr:hypothetical protein CEXT_457141 [Caerostris extrusa]